MQSRRKHLHSQARWTHVSLLDAEPQSPGDAPDAALVLLVLLLDEIPSLRFQLLDLLFQLSTICHIGKLVQVGRFAEVAADSDGVRGVVQLLIHFPVTGRHGLRRGERVKTAVVRFERRAETVEVVLAAGTAETSHDDV